MEDRIAAIHRAWRSHHKKEQDTQIQSVGQANTHNEKAATSTKQRLLLLVLLHRAWLKSRRDMVAYGVRIAMYLVCL